MCEWTTQQPFASYFFPPPEEEAADDDLTDRIDRTDISSPLPCAVVGVIFCSMHLGQALHNTFHPPVIFFDASWTFL